MVEIKEMTIEHFDEVMEMMRVFYASPAVLSNGSEEIFRNDIEHCINDSPYLEGYVFIENSCKCGYDKVAILDIKNSLNNKSENVVQINLQQKEDKKTTLLGYAMVAKSFSTEFGKPCMWIEDLYMKPQYRGMGIGTQFFSFIEQKYPNAILRLEVEEENELAIYVYQKCGFEKLPYMEMKK